METTSGSKYLLLVLVLALFVVFSFSCLVPFDVSRVYAFAVRKILAACQLSAIGMLFVRIQCCVSGVDKCGVGALLVACCCFISLLALAPGLF